MFTKAKYIITPEDRIIVFGEVLSHSDFRAYNPIRAGFIQFGVNRSRNTTCSCYGESVTLKLKSDPELDTFLAHIQLGLQLED